MGVRRLGSRVCSPGLAFIRDLYGVNGNDSIIRVLGLSVAG